MRQEQEKSEDKSQADEEVERPPPEVELGYVDTWINAAEWVGITFFFFRVQARILRTSPLYHATEYQIIPCSHTSLSLSFSVFMCLLILQGCKRPNWRSVGC
jgi:hypothetical protein